MLVAPDNRSVRMYQRLEQRIVDLDGEKAYLVSISSRDCLALPFVHRDSPVLGRVSMGANPREAIYVDRRSRLLDILVNKAIRKAKEMPGRVKDNLLYSIYETVKATMTYGEEETDRMIRYYGAGNDRLMSIDRFIEFGTGVCRHNALICAAMIELCQENDYLRQQNNNLTGRVSVDRNTTNQGGHTWARYTTSGGIVWILDVSQGFFGALHDPRTIEAVVHGRLWPYYRTEDV